MDIQQAIEEEIEALKSIFFDQFNTINDMLHTIHIQTEYKDLVLTIAYGTDYHPDLHLSHKLQPNVPRGLTESLKRGESWDDFGEEDISELMDLIRGHLVETHVVFEVVNCIHDFLDQRFAAKYANKDAKPTLELSESQLQGTAVTVESFTNWWTSFQHKVTPVKVTNSKRTGKEIFESGEQGVLD